MSQSSSSPASASAPERNRRVDVYEPGGFNRQLPDYATVSLHRGSVA